MNGRLARADLESGDQVVITGPFRLIVVVAVSSTRLARASPRNYPFISTEDVPLFSFFFSSSFFSSGSFPTVSWATIRVVFLFDSISATLSRA